jgi:hypothetical protein
MYLNDSPAASFPRDHYLGQSLPPVPYKEPFPIIKKECPWEHRGAMDAYLALQNIKWFEPFHRQLYEAAHNSKLSLGRGDELRLNPDPEALRKLVVNEVGNEVAVNIAGAVGKWAFGPEIARLFHLADLIHKFLAIYEGIQNTKLVNEQDRSLWKEALQKKLSLFIDIKARALVRKNPQLNEFKVRSWLHDNYWLYDKRRSAVARYYLMEEGHCGRERIQPRMSPA